MDKPRWLLGWAQEGTGKVMSKRSVVLEIAGQKLSLRTNRDDAYLQSLTDYVSDQVTALKGAAPRAPFEKICLLVALQIADELFAERDHSETLQQEFERRSMAMLDFLDRELGHTDSDPRPQQPAWSETAEVTQGAARRRPDVR